MYDSYTYQILQWLQRSGLDGVAAQMEDLIGTVNDLLTILTYILYAVLFFGFIWIFKKFLLNILFS